MHLLKDLHGLGIHLSMVPPVMQDGQKTLRLEDNREEDGQTGLFVTHVIPGSCAHR